MNFQQRDIYLIEFGPGKGHEYQKFRPGIILMTDQVIKKSNIITCVPLTSNGDNCLDDDIEIKKDNENLLKENSIIKMHHITACDKSRLRKYIGRIGEQDWRKIVIKLKVMLGIN